MVTRADAAARVRLYLDDSAAVVATTAQVEDALRTAQAEVMSFLAAEGWAPVLREALVATNAQGLADLSGIKPLKLAHVALSDAAGDLRTPVPPVSWADHYARREGVESLVVRYVARPLFPTSGGDPFLWGGLAALADDPLLDDLMVHIAASQLKTIEGERNGPLEERKGELREAVRRRVTVPSWALLSQAGPSRRLRTRIYYVMQGLDALQLVF